MDRAQQLVQMLRADLSVTAKLDALVDVGRVDAGVAPFLSDVLTDAREPVEVRLQALKRLRDSTLTNGTRERVARAILRVLQDRSQQLRLRGALALAEFTDVWGVPSALGELALDPDVSLDLRYSAFTSLERAGPTPECVAVARKLLPDSALGDCARTLLTSWGEAELQ
jgi:hypothetical protein